MTYVDGFVIPVARENREKFLKHARHVDAIFREYGALRVVECWEDDVPDGKVTDFRRSVALGEGEIVVFAWIEWPDKETRDAAFKELPKDPRSEQVPVPFDGKRMIFGGFTAVVDI
ncbi:DUF1428 domain-containing protein [Sphingomonas tabacisoli]|uniref:DUF1428 domain-containing protein n=1 Tax=Sphingomonas tabacisoli TaxID=2249466 RepID=A0ABW4HXC0_9SPHN